MRAILTAAISAGWRGVSGISLQCAVQDRSGAQVRCGRPDKGPTPEAAMKFVRTVVVV